MTHIHNENTMKLTYKEALMELQAEWARWNTIPRVAVRPSDLLHVNKVMQGLFPGDYKVIFQFDPDFDPDDRKIVFKLHFNDPSQETLFLLKYG